MHGWSVTDLLITLARDYAKIAGVASAFGMLLYAWCYYAFNSQTGHTFYFASKFFTEATPFARVSAGFFTSVVVMRYRVALTQSMATPSNLPHSPSNLPHSPSNPPHCTPSHSIRCGSYLDPLGLRRLLGMKSPAATSASWVVGVAALTGLGGLGGVGGTGIADRSIRYPADCVALA
jgi:hypothetical protein